MTLHCSVYIATSLDGFIARKDGSLDWLTVPTAPSSDEDYGYKEFFNSIDVLVLGWHTYETVLGFAEWPYAGKKVVVLSSGSPKVPDHLTGSVEFTAESPTEVVQHLSQAGLQHAYVDGGRAIQSFLRAGLIDNLTLTRLPVLIGDGIPLFGPLDRDIHLQHLETKAYANGFVQSRYRVINGESPARVETATHS